MSYPLGTIVSISADLAVVSVDGMPACARCAEGRGCGAGLFGQGRAARLVDARIPDGLGVAVGDPVRLSVPPSELLAASLLAYGAPLAGLVLGALASVAVPQSAGDSAAILLALLGLVSGFAIGRWRLRRVACPRRFRPVVERSA
ncbi:MAG: SoxR reducing system RseC family protein [Gammaproteobacteria bacterium]|nr:SoxR reducing system RseC family protein [Gammaproteobacteria bacterium]MDH4252902.1 SoxR reducing system RseC family protein [Gammaproteobacteria bacterium]MDH5308412.1 SoxR reducing system RseC family protein [Gammaproteobacteria bacterium]